MFRKLFFMIPGDPFLAHFSSSKFRLAPHAGQQNHRRPRVGGKMIVSYHGTPRKPLSARPCRRFAAAGAGREANKREFGVCSWQSLSHRRGVGGDPNLELLSFEIRSTKSE